MCRLYKIYAPANNVDVKAFLYKCVLMNVDNDSNNNNNNCS